MSFEIFVSAETKPDWFSKKIMRYMGCNYSHVGILVDETVIHHSVGQGFCQVLATKFLHDHVFVGRMPVRVISDAYARGYLAGMVGIEYSESQYFGIVLPWLAKLTKNGKEKLICSEAVAYFLTECCNIPILNQDCVTPKQIWQRLNGEG